MKLLIINLEGTYIFIYLFIIYLFFIYLFIYLKVDKHQKHKTMYIKNS